jgi:hypothetical protein
MVMADKALVLAVNLYESVSALRGCINDAADMTHLLVETFGFPPENVKVMVDAEVRKSRVRPAMSWLFEDARPGDRVALHFSGHGSRIPNRGKDTEDDRLDELICLADMDFERPSSFFLDDELRRWTRRCPAGVHLTVFLDCCHSGTGTRKLIPPVKTLPTRQYPRIIEHATALRAVRSRVQASGLRGVRPMGTVEELADLARAVNEAAPEDQVLARFVEPPEDQAARVQKLVELGRAPRAAGPFDADPKMNHVLLAACQDFQTAADAFIDGKYRGAFTCTLGRVCREAGRQLDRHELLERVVRALADQRFEQQPRLEGPALYGPLFAEGSPGPSDGHEPKPAPEPVPPQPVLPPGPSDGLVPPPAPTPPPDWPAGEAEGVEVFRELLATYNRLLDILKPAERAMRPVGAAPSGARHLVYIHGIGTHGRNFSEQWWSSMARWTPSLQPGVLSTKVDPPDGNRHEVIWSSHVNDVRSRAAAGPEAASADVQAQALARQIQEQLDDRRLQYEMAAQALQPEAARAAAPPATATATPEERVVARGLFSSLDDFALYMANDAVRIAVLDEFFRIVPPLLRQGFVVDLIAHSWGTVVAYEALRQLDGDLSLPAGSVRDFFTVGAALSIPAVCWNLFGRVVDGRKPRLVRRWVNLDARGDFVGGALRPRGFALAASDEHTGLFPTSCNPILPSLGCAHGSYFQRDNLAVNRDIFGAVIEGA